MMQKGSIQYQNIKCLWLGFKFTTIYVQIYKILFSIFKANDNKLFKEIEKYKFHHEKYQRSL